MLVEFSFPSLEGSIYFLFEVDDEKQFKKDLKECLEQVIRKSYKEKLEFIKANPGWKDFPEIRIERIAYPLYKCLKEKGYKKAKRATYLADAWAVLDKDGKFCPFYEESDYEKTEFEQLIEEIAMKVVETLNNEG